MSGATTDIIRVPQVAEQTAILCEALDHLQELFLGIAIADRRAIGVNPDAALFHANLAGILQAAGRPQEAVASYEQALQLNEDCAETHHKLGNVLRQLSRLDEAADCYQRAIELNPEVLSEVVFW